MLAQRHASYLARYGASRITCRCCDEHVMNPRDTWDTAVYSDSSVYYTDTDNI